VSNEVLKLVLMFGWPMVTAGAYFIGRRERRVLRLEWKVFPDEQIRKKGQ